MVLLGLCDSPDKTSAQRTLVSRANLSVLVAHEHATDGQPCRNNALWLSNTRISPLGRSSVAWRAGRHNVSHALDWSGAQFHAWHFGVPIGDRTVDRPVLARPGWAAWLLVRRSSSGTPV